MMKNVFNQVTLQSLKKNKTRTVVTIIGIILSAAMICAVTTFASSIYDYAMRISMWGDGSWHGNESDTTFSTYEDIINAKEVEKAVYLQQIGYAKAEGCVNEFKPYIYVLGASVGTEKMLPIHITSGKYPTKADEILLPEHLASNGGVKYNIGDTVTLALGDRILDGFQLHQSNPVYVENEERVEELNGEVLTVRETRTYQVVGFYERLTYRIEEYSAPGYTALTVADEKTNGDYCYDVYFEMKKPKTVFEFMEKHGYTGEQNTDVLMYQGATKYDSFSVMVASLAAIVIALIMFGSIALIYNAFSISVSERTKQFGLLSSIGATKKQLRKMVMFEALVVAAIGIPLGILSGIIGIGITLAVIGEQFSTLLGYDAVTMRICVSWEAILIAMIVALVTVLLSAWIPSKRATKVSAVEAIRQSHDIKLGNQVVKTSKLTYRLFGLPGVLASKHYKRNKRKYRATVLSLFMSIVLFVSASAFTEYLMETVGGGLATSGYDLVYNTPNSELKGKTPDEFLALIQSEETVKEATYVHTEYVNGIISHQYLTQFAIDTLMSGDANAPVGYEAQAENYGSVSAHVFFISDNEYKKLLEKYHLAETEFMNPDNPLGIAIDGNTTFDRKKQKYTKSYLLRSDKSEIIYTKMAEAYFEDYSYSGEHTDESGNVIVELSHWSDFDKVLELPYEEVFISQTFKTGKTIQEVPYFIEGDLTSGLRILYPISLYEHVIPESIRAENPYYQFYMTSTDHKATEKNLNELLNENGLATERLYNYAQGADENRSIVSIIRVFSYGFIILISLIAAANVFNTISTNIALRRREFAMLKSVGMSEKGFQQMMNYECLLYGSKALLYGLPVSCGITYFIFLAIMEGYETTFRLPWGAIGIAVLSVFLVVFATMMYSMRKIKKDNPIDALKNENL